MKMSDENNFRFEPEIFLFSNIDEYFPVDQNA